MDKEYKLKLLKKLATDFWEINDKGINDQYPINAFYVFPNLAKYRFQIISQISKDYKKYSEIKLIQTLQMLFYKPMDPPNKLINNILNELIIRRKDPTISKSLELKKYKPNKLSEIDISKHECKKYVLYAEINTDINYPIFRGFGFNIYTKEDRFYKEYELNGNRFMYSCKMIKKPKYLMTGHNSKEGQLSDYKFYGILPKKPQFKIYKSDNERIKYVIKCILRNLNIKINISNTIIIPINKELKLLTKEEKRKLINKTYKFLISKIE